MVEYDFIGDPQIRVTSPQAVNEITRRLIECGVSFKTKLSRVKKMGPIYLIKIYS
jgi:hypothetical protein